MSRFNSVVVTGAGGMLGHALVDLLNTRGVKPIALDRASLDISDRAALEKIFAEHKPTLLLNAAAHTKVDLCEQEKEKADAINGYAVGHMAELSKQFGTTFVHVSTDFVFDGRGTRPYRVDDPVGPVSAYGQSKLLGETQLQKHAPKDWLIVRTAWVYGRHGANFPRTMVTAARAGKPLRVVSDQIGAPTCAPDLALAILDLLDKNARGVFNVTNSGETSWHGFAQATMEEFGIDTTVEPVTSAQWAQMRPNTAHRPAYSVLDLTPFETATGRPMRPWREALHDFRRAVEKANSF